MLRKYIESYFYCAFYRNLLRYIIWYLDNIPTIDARKFQDNK